MKQRNFSEERTSSDRPNFGTSGKKHAKLNPVPKKFQNSRQWLELDEEDDDYDGGFLFEEEEEEEEE